MFFLYFVGPIKLWDFNFPNIMLDDSLIFFSFISGRLGLRNAESLLYFTNTKIYFSSSSILIRFIAVLRPSITLHLPDITLIFMESVSSLLIKLSLPFLYIKLQPVDTNNVELTFRIETRSWGDKNPKTLRDNYRVSFCHFLNSSSLVIHLLEQSNRKMTSF